MNIRYEMWDGKLLNGSLGRFIVKRVLICLILLSIIVIIVFDTKIPVLIGLLLGTTISVFKLGSNAWIISRIAGVEQDGGRKKFSSNFSSVIYALTQIVSLLLLYMAYRINQWGFAGFAAGLLTVPFVLMINSITEALGITRNNFG
jgi:hypothetical protein